MAPSSQPGGTVPMSHQLSAPYSGSRCDFPSPLLSLFSQMWTSVRTTTVAASRSASMPWAAMSASATLAFSSVTTSTPASTAPTVSAAPAPPRQAPLLGRHPSRSSPTAVTAGQHSPHPPPQQQAALGSPSSTPGSQVKASNFGGGLNGCFVLMMVSLQALLPACSLHPLHQACWCS